MLWRPWPLFLNIPAEASVRNISTPRLNSQVVYVSVERSYCESPVVQGISLGTVFALPLEYFFFNRRTFGCILNSMYKTVVAMVTQLNELRPLAEVDCYKGRRRIAFHIKFGMANLKVIQRV